MAKVAIVTGAAQNIGKGIAKGLIENGYECILIDNNKALLHETYSELSSLGLCHEYGLDIGNTDGINSFVSWLADKNIAVDVLINNVGYESKDSLSNLSVSELEASSRVNLEGPFYLTAKITQHMVETGLKGNIIFITSTHSKVTRMHPLYSAAKAGIEMFMKEAALELSSSGIRVNSVAPGPVIDTNSPRESKYVPLGFTLQPQDVAESVLFLISDKARFITAQTLVVDGGFSEVHTHYWLQKNELK